MKARSEHNKRIPLLQLGILTQRLIRRRLVVPQVTPRNEPRRAVRPRRFLARDEEADGRFPR